MNEVTLIAAWVGAIGALASGSMAILTEIRRKHTENRLRNEAKEAMDIIRKEAKEAEERLRKETMRDEYTLHITNRRIFWSDLENAYNLFRQNNANLPTDLKALVDKCGMPPGLNRFEYITHYVLQNGTDFQEAMERFAESIYPKDYETQEHRRSRSLIHTEAFDNWNTSRSVLGDFWDKWTNRLGVEYISRHPDYSKNRQMVILLSWLDISHRKQVKELHKGKRDMYKLGNRLQQLFLQEFS